jgi:hypothetical protein
MRNLIAPIWRKVFITHSSMRKSMTCAVLIASQNQNKIPIVGTLILVGTAPSGLFLFYNGGMA